MGDKIYKYFSHNVMNLVFERKGFCAIKCSCPNEYNDPFELFLGVDIDIGPEGLATYRELIYEIPQYPTTCFSKSPVVAPMWAHYAQNHSGFVIEFDVDLMKEALPDVSIHEIVYREQPDESISANLARAAVTKKPRHAVWLQQAVLHHAYFSKYTVWSYEQECRLVDDGQRVEAVSGNSILFIPMKCVTALIVGKNIPSEESQRSKDVCEINGLSWFQSCIGKSLEVPFLRDSHEAVFVFDGRSIVKGNPVCDECKQPFKGDGDLCPWCSIQVEHEYEAALGNPFRILERTGGLEEYFNSILKIQRKSKKS
jgi:Protein of unknown function (DUF2971)